MPITLDGTNGITTPMYNGSITANAVTPSVNMKNRIINGNMVIDQRNAGASVTVTNANPIYTVDRWGAYASVTSRFTAQQNAGSVSVLGATGFTNYLGITSSAATSVGASDFYFINQPIEVCNISDLSYGTANAKTTTLSFWVYSSLTGSFGGAIRNTTNNKSYVFAYTVSSANTWTYITVTIPGDTATAISTTPNATGLWVVFSLGMGSNNTTTNTGTWVTGGFNAPNSTVSVVGTNGATFYITGVQLEVGSTATSFDYRPYGTELALCQRYFQTSYSGNAVGSATTNNQLGYWYAATSNYSTTLVGLQVNMRSAPTVTIYSPNTGASGKMYVNGTGDVNAAAQNAGVTSFQAYVNNVSVTAGTNTFFHYTAAIEL